MLDNLDAWATKASGALGAAIAALYLGGSTREIALQFFAGAAASYYIAPWTAVQLKAPEGMVGFLLGSAAIFTVKRIVVAVDGLDLRSHLDAALGRLTGKKPSDGGQ